MIRSILSFVLIAAFAAVGVWGVQYFKTTRITLLPKEKIEKPAVRTEFFTAAPVTVSAQSVAKGVVEAYRTARVSPEISGKVVEVNEKAVIGYSVARDEVLVRLDTTLLLLDKANLDVSIQSAKLAVDTALLDIDRINNELASAAENLKIVDAIYQRNLELFQRGSLSQNSLDLDRLNLLNASRAVQSLKDSLAISRLKVESARINVTNLEAQLAKIEATIAKSEIRAPWPAFVSKRNVELGEYVSPASQMFFLTRCDRLYFTTLIPAEDFAGIQKGVKASVKLYDIDNLTLSGIVEDLGIDVDPRSRSYTVRILLDLSEEVNANLRPGFFGEATIPLETRKYDIAIPTRSVLNDGGRPYVYVIKDGRADLRYIVTGRNRNGNIEVIDGLVIGEVVAASNVERLVTDIGVVEDSAALNDDAAGN